MSSTHSFILKASFGVLFLGAACLLFGCGDSTPKTGTTVYSSPEEVSAKNQGLKDAMKGGAYGSAGKKAANSIQ
ncbi:hypothetical protein [Paludisphaera mucosa]|uniref:Lipoprotein n=1 Tax=Paludisphaera mucosa TaxID=3030827 RepID=A0ABT6FFK2_9BACT|nr:hypothetical protein [Paludisphaera mucosa]MDG3006339.1 hypothetical protein [Paludisphaera mucosa]